MKATEMRTIEQLGGITFRKTGLADPAIAAYSSVGVVFCNDKGEARNRTIHWDFCKRATIAEVHKLNEVKVSKLLRRTE